MSRMLIAAAALAAIAVSSGAAAQEKLKFAVFTPDNEMTHQIVMKPWAERVNKDSGGTLDIQTFPMARSDAIRRCRPRCCRTALPTSPG